MVWVKLKRVSCTVLVLVVLYIVFKDSPFNRSYIKLKRHLVDQSIIYQRLWRLNDTIKYNKLVKEKTNVYQTLKKIAQKSIKDPVQLHRKSSCKPQEVVVFIKTHKTGSSTITNILNRYADLNDLKVALPMANFYRFRWPVPFHWSAVDLWRLDGDLPSILSNHARYNRPTMQLIMQKGAKYITILRNPVQQYESMFEYMEFHQYLQLNNSKNTLLDFLENPVSLIYKMRDRYHGIPEPMNLIKNPMTFDLGLYPPSYDNMTKVKKEMKKTERDFELVMIMEYFDESLILLKKAFCWEFEDILYVKFNQRPRSRDIHLSKHVKKKILEWNKADTMFYDFFNKTLWKKIYEFGPSFWEELREFKKRNSRFQEICIDNKVHIDGLVRSYHLNPKVSRYDRYLCKKVIRNEIEYIKYFRDKYRPFGSYQNILEKEGRKKPSTRELIGRLQMISNIKTSSDSIPRAVS